MIEGLIMGFLRLWIQDILCLFGLQNILNTSFRINNYLTNYIYSGSKWSKVEHSGGESVFKRAFVMPNLKPLYPQTIISIISKPLYHIYNGLSSILKAPYYIPNLYICQTFVSRNLQKSTKIVIKVYKGLEKFLKRSKKN